MAYVLPLLSVVACPLSMGVMMWLMMRSQGTHTQDSTSGMATSQPPRMRLCINWKVVAALTWGAFVLWLVAPNLFWLAVPLLIIAACPLSMLLMMRGMRREDFSPAQAKETPPTAEEQLSAVYTRRKPLGRELVQLEAIKTVEPDQKPVGIQID